MKPHSIAFLVSVVALATFLFQINHLRQLNEEAAVLTVQIENANSLTANSGALIRSVFDGFTLGVFADDGIFTESKRLDREAQALSMGRASLLARAENAVFYRNGGLVLAIISGVAGLLMKPSTPVSYAEPGLDLEDEEDAPPCFGVSPK